MLPNQRDCVLSLVGLLGSLGPMVTVPRAIGLRVIVPTVTGPPVNGVVLVPRVIVLKATAPKGNGVVLVLKGKADPVVPVDQVVLLVPTAIVLPTNGAIALHKVIVPQGRGIKGITMVPDPVAQAVPVVLLAPTAIVPRVKVTRGTTMDLVPAALVVLVTDLVPVVLVVPVTDLVPAALVVPATVLVPAAPAMVLALAVPATGLVPAVALVERLPLTSPRALSPRSFAPRKRKLTSRKKRSSSTRPTRPRSELRPRPTLFPRKSRSWRSSPSPSWPGR